MEEKIYTDTELSELEDLPFDGDETTESAETATESAESAHDDTADAENANVSEETETKTEESTEKKEKTEEKKADDDKYKHNLPTGFSFNPLVMAIKPFYEKAIAEDELFAKEVREKESRKDNPKSLAECAEYILGEAYNYAYNHKDGQFGMAGFPDEEMPNLIKHYYDEDGIVIRKVGASARTSFTHTPNTATAPAPAKGRKKGADKPKPVKNVLDISKAIVSATMATEDGQKAKREKKKDNLLAGFVPMERPNLETYEKDGKKGSREQAKSVSQMDLFAEFFSE